MILVTLPIIKIFLFDKALIGAMEVHLGIDDTDSKKGMCTTYIGALVRDELKRFSKVSELRLVRLNPNIPWKTRGNGAVAMTIETDDVPRVERTAVDAVREHSALAEEGTNPGVVVLEGEVTPELRDFYYKALRDVVSIEEGTELAAAHSCRVHKFKNGRGIIGALAAIGADLSTHTWELTAYREPRNWGKARKVDPASVIEMERATHPYTFNNIDPEPGRILITPRSPCPILLGIRSRREGILEPAMKIINTGEPIERSATFKTNQGTDAHLVQGSIASAKPFTSLILSGRVMEPPNVVEGGHVIFRIGEDGHSIDCAAYEPTGDFREIVKELRKGDHVKVSGGVKETKSLTLNLEKLEIIQLEEQTMERNPLCPSCGRRMKSSGKGQGFRCKRCRTKAWVKEKASVERELKTGVYSVPPRAMRHLSRPIQWLEYN